MQSFAPAPALSNVWYAQEGTVNASATTMPFLQHELVLNLGDEFSVSGATTADNVVFSPIRTNSIVTSVKGRYEAVGLLFNPIGIYQCYGISVAELLQAQSASELLPGPKEEFLQLLEQATGHQQKIEATTAFFERYSCKREIPNVVLRFLQRVAVTPSHHLGQLAHELNVSSKHLRSTVRSVLGISPKKYLQLVQLQHVLNEMASTSNMSMTHCSLSNGFYDQAHFNRVFKNFTGMAPGAYYRSSTRGQYGPCHTLMH